AARRDLVRAARAGALAVAERQRGAETRPPRSGDLAKRHGRAKRAGAPSAPAAASDVAAWAGAARANPCDRSLDGRSARRLQQPDSGEREQSDAAGEPDRGAARF